MSINEQWHEVDTEKMYDFVLKKKRKGDCHHTIYVATYNGAGEYLITRRRALDDEVLYRMFFRDSASESDLMLKMTLKEIGYLLDWSDEQLVYHQLKDSDFTLCIREI